MKANPVAFRNRLERVKAGVIQSAFDEFLERRIPIQLGGMFDPFTEIEVKERATLELMRCLKDFSYPTLISTKGNLFTRQEYLSVLKNMNVHLRISAVGISEEYRKSIDIGCDTISVVINKIKLLKDIGVPVSLRIQPVIPGFERSALSMTEKAARVGVSQVSYEYLKISSESRDYIVKEISNTTGTNIWEVMKENGIISVGRDYTMKKSAKWAFLKKAQKLCKELGVVFGAGDTEFIHLSDGGGCCNGSEFFLRDSNQFRTNFVGVLSQKGGSGEIKFSNLFKEWIPQHNVHRYLTTNSRSRDKSKKYPSLLGLLSYRWNGGKGPYSPEFFFGVRWDGNYDTDGYKIYQYKDPFD